MKKKSNNWLVFIVGGVIAVIIVGIIISLFVSKKEPDPSPSEKNPDNPPSDKLSEKDLEKYLLEKRLELKKYFVFNLSELKLLSDSDPRLSNVRACSSRLSNDLTKMTRVWGAKRKKISILFEKEKHNNNSEWRGTQLDEKIKNMDCWIIFEKDKNNKYRFFGDDLANFELNGIIWQKFEPALKVILLTERLALKRLLLAMLIIKLILPTDNFLSKLFYLLIEPFPKFF